MSNLLKLAKGDILIRENDTSNSLFYVQSGTLRVFKKKGKGFIELGVISQGNLVGELSFFDNQRRSASVEALRDCEVIEVPRFNFEEFMATQPTWASALFRTMSAKVRLLTEHVKELETNSMTTKLDENNRTFREHEFLLAREVIKLCSSLYLCATLNGSLNQAGVTQFPASAFQTLAANVNSIQLAKITAFIDLLKDLGLLEMERTPQRLLLGIRDLPTLGRFLFWLSEDTAKPTEAKSSLSSLAVQLGEAIWATGLLQQTAPDQEYRSVDLMSLAQQLADQKGLSSQLYVNIFDEIADGRLGRDVMTGTKTRYEINVSRFLSDFPMLRIKSRIDALNAQKRGTI